MIIFALLLLFADYNQELAESLQLEKNSNGNGLLELNIGNTFFKLEQYPWAILYYNKSLKLRPRDEKVKENLKRALDALSLESTDQKSLFAPLFYFHTKLSLAERLKLYSLFAILCFTSYAFYLVKSKKWALKAALACLVVGIFFLLSALWSLYLSPQEAIVIEGTNLYQGAGTQFLQVQNNPLLKGSKVRVLFVFRGENFAKIVSEEGLLGYVPLHSIRPI